MVVQPGQDWDRDNGTGPLNCPTGARLEEVHDEYCERM